MKQPYFLLKYCLIFLYHPYENCMNLTKFITNKSTAPIASMIVTHPPNVTPKNTKLEIWVLVTAAVMP